MCKLSPFYNTNLDIWVLEIFAECPLVLLFSVDWLSFVIRYTHQIKFTNERSVSFLSVYYFYSTIKVFYGLLPVLAHTGKNHCSPPSLKTPSSYIFGVMSFLPKFRYTLEAHFSFIDIHFHTHTKIHTLTHTYTIERKNSDGRSSAYNSL